MHNYKELKIWQRAMELAEKVYLVTADFPSEEKFGLTIQMRKSAISVPSNIAEGCGRRTDKQLHHFLSISLGSLCELDTQILLSLRLGIMNAQTAEKHSIENNEIQKMIFGFMESLKL